MLYEEQDTEVEVKMASFKVLALLLYWVCGLFKNLNSISQVIVHH